MNAAIPCLVSRAENRAADRIEKAQATQEACYILLANELRNALAAPDLRKALVSTPGYADKLGGTQQMSVVDLFSDLFAGSHGDLALGDLLSIVSAAARGEQVTHRAVVWVGFVSAIHANYHAGDMASGVES